MQLLSFSSVLLFTGCVAGKRDEMRGREKASGHVSVDNRYPRERATVCLCVCVCLCVKPYKRMNRAVCVCVLYCV